MPRIASALAEQALGWDATVDTPAQDALELHAGVVTDCAYRFELPGDASR